MKQLKLEYNMDWNEMLKRIVEKPVGLICLTIIFCAMVFGMYSCVNAEYQYNLKKLEIMQK